MGDVVKMKKIVDFVSERGIQKSAVQMYIKRHPELFDGHIRIEGNAQIADREALSILEKKYPLPKPVEIITDTESLQLLADERKKNQELLALIAEMKEQVAVAKTQQIMLEDKQRQIEEQRLLLTSLNEQKNSTESELRKEIEQRAKAEAELENAMKIIDDQRDAVAKLKNRGLLARILNKDS